MIIILFRRDSKTHSKNKQHSSCLQMSKVEGETNDCYFECDFIFQSLNCESFQFLFNYLKTNTHPWNEKCLRFFISFGSLSKLLKDDVVFISCLWAFYISVLDYYIKQFQFK